MAVNWEEELGIKPSEVEKLQAKLSVELAMAREQDEEFDGSAVEAASFNRSEVIEAMRLDLNFLASIAIPDAFVYEFPPAYQAYWDLLIQAEEGKLPPEVIGMLNPKFPQLALGIPRGFSKTTMIKLFIFRCILFSTRKFFLIIGETEAKASAIVSDICDMLNEPNVKAIFGDWRTHIELEQQGLKKFSFRNKVVVIVGIGVGSSLRGLNIKHLRPDVMLFDDIQSREAAESQTISEGIEKWMVGTAFKARSPHGCMHVFLGNMYPTQYSLLKRLKSNKHWIKLIAGCILEDGTSLWEELFPLADLLEELDNDIAAGHPEIFFSEKMNDTEAGINSKYDLSGLKQWPWSEHEQPQGKYIVIDPASARKGGDDVAIGYFEVYDGTPGLRDCHEENLSPGNTIKAALLLALRTGTRCIAVESTAYQFTLLYWFEQVCTQLGIPAGSFHFVEVYTGMNSKNYRITETIKAMTQGEIVLHGEVRTKVLNQISNWNPLKRDNVDGLLDLLAHSRKVMEMYGPLIAVESDPIILEASQARVNENLRSF